MDLHVRANFWQTFTQDSAKKEARYGDDDEHGHERFSRPGKPHLRSLPRNNTPSSVTARRSLKPKAPPSGCKFCCCNRGA